MRARATLTMAILTMALLTMALLLEARRELGCAPLYVSVQEALEHGTEDVSKVSGAARVTLLLTTT